ncbi:MAG: hypothetical protein HQK81_11645 [Desulfovibrionaceae bacterium]|nr:hypothetical protein [Desulfovibrionaceae bacterium]MBF0514695.1 hypothetical protein [Desulfovibrionaceae bacterium]
MRRAAALNEVIRFTVKHFHEKLARYGIARSYTWTKNTLQTAGFATRAPKRGAHRRKRPRKPLPGMMLHQDGSRHEWVAGRSWDLIVTLDDATDDIYSAFFVAEEDTLSAFEGVRPVIARHGLFCSLYVDRGSHYFKTPEAGGKVDKLVLQVFPLVANRLKSSPEGTHEGRGPVFADSRPGRVMVCRGC